MNIALFFRDWSGSKEEISQREAGFIKVQLLRWKPFECVRVCVCVSPGPAV